MPSEPCSTRCLASAWNASKSIDPSSWNGVTIAVRTLPSIRRLYVPSRSGILARWRPSCSSTGPGTAPGAGVRSRSGLERRGHRVETPHLPCDEPGLSVEDCAAFVGSHPDAVVVGHSLGAQIVSLVDARPPRLPRRAAAHRSARTARGLPPATSAGSCATSSAAASSPMPTHAQTGCISDCSVNSRCCIRAASHWHDEGSRRSSRRVCRCSKARQAGARIVSQLETGHSPFVTHPAELTELLDGLA